MDRRSTLAALLGQKSTKKSVSKQAVSGKNDLQPYTGPWEDSQASHLLRRTLFGPTYAQIKEAAVEGMDATVDALLADVAMPSPPINPDFADDPNVPIGAPWNATSAVYSPDINLRGYRNRSLWSWQFELMIKQGLSIREKMTLFWHNHFVTERAAVSDPKYNLIYINLLRQHALGNFRELVKKITIDPSMLRYLNGHQNTRTAPNENYARELLELFTIGKGPLVGPGDYTTYTEDDVITIARILTGWRYRGFNSNQETPIEAYFTTGRHDTTRKKLSTRFGKAIIDNEGDQEYLTLIDLIFEQDEVARFISRKLYRWFVYHEITEKIERNVIEPMAQMLIDNDYEIKPVLRALLKSSHFYRTRNIGPVIKSPVEFIVGLINQLEVDYDKGFALNYRYWYLLHIQSRNMQMEYFSPPNVAGWKAYYQEPVFYQTWINSVTLPIRMAFTDTFVRLGFRINGSNRVYIDVLKLAASVDNAMDPNELIKNFALIFFPQPITENQLTYLKEILIPGLPDFEWTVEYGDHLAHPDDVNLKMAVEAKLRNVINAMVKMPEYFLC